jgi:hypothetical protein
MTATLRIVAILAVDVVGYSRPMSENEAWKARAKKSSLKSGISRAVTCKSINDASPSGNRVPGQP